MRQAHPSDAVTLQLVGAFELRDPKQPIHVRPSTERLLAYLAIAGRPVRRAALAEAVCGDGDEPSRRPRNAAASAGTRLRSALWRIPRPGGRALVDAGTTGVRLAPGVAVDYKEAELAAHCDYTRLVEDLLPDWDEDWVIVERERYRQVRLHALERLCVQHREHGEYDLALRAGLTAIGSEPLRESAHRHVIEAHLAEGNPAEALRQYETFRRLLRDQLGLAPSPAIRALVRDYLGRPADPA
jgi:DNA-binding SARP family transcriptional activator